MFMWNVYADLFKGNINLSVRVFFFFRGLGGESPLRVFFVLFCLFLIVSLAEPL